MKSYSATVYRDSEPHNKHFTVLETGKRLANDIKVMWIEEIDVLADIDEREWYSMVKDRCGDNDR